MGASMVGGDEMTEKESGESSGETKPPKMPEN
uniref:Uncharacterized protein n=1 Tax=viral metagenome TaxID=1070528 RepID=A0A6C0KKK3_9ZZZZ